jgi:hypothetical protein
MQVLSLCDIGYLDGCPGVGLGERIAGLVVRRAD